MKFLFYVYFITIKKKILKHKRKNPLHITTVHEVPWNKPSQNFIGL